MPSDTENSTAKKRVLVVGQVPPPWGGQAVMIRKLLDAQLPDVDLEFVAMTFSEDMNEIGRFRWKKLLRLPLLVWRIWRARWSSGCRILYYPPGGESLTAICRDAFVLILCRPFFQKTVFHVHAGGFTEVAEQAPWLVRKLAFWGYNKPDMVIRLTEKSPPDSERIRAHQTISVANGLPDAACQVPLSYVRDTSKPLQLLYVGVISPSKGVMILLEACTELVRMKVDFRIFIAGRFYSPAFEAECRAYIQQQGLENRIVFAGVVVGDDKWALFRRCDIFCFPTHFESENQSLVILEAMQFGLPCIASDWRGISSMVVDGINGYLVPIKDPSALALKVALLAEDEPLREKMGRESRAAYLDSFTEEVWWRNMNKVLGGI